MKYFYDTEFLEGTQTKRFLGIPYGKTKPTIDLVSIGIVAEDGRELYLISKEFNLREAWERYDLKPDINQGGMKKVYWIRENVLETIYFDLLKKANIYGDERNYWSFTYKNLKRLINKYGYTNAEIAEKVKEFVYNQTDEDKYYNQLSVMPIELYGYYSAYDHVGLCWLFGVMNDLPDGFPMFTIDLKQMLDNKIPYHSTEPKPTNWDTHINNIKNHPQYPKQTNEHNALADARWNKELHNFIKSL
jgi:hypothetical protein